MTELAPYRKHLILVDEDGKILGEKRATLVPGEPDYTRSVVEELRSNRRREQKHRTYQEQIKKLKREGRYGTHLDPMWNALTGHHDCCGSPRAYYHRKECKRTK